VVKFKDHIELPYESDESLQQFFEANDVIGYNSVKQDFPEAIAGRMLRSVEENELKQLRTQLIESGKTKGSGYEPPNLCTYCVLLCPASSADTRTLLDRLQANADIEYAYIEKKLVARAPGESLGNPTNNLSQGYLEPAPLGVDSHFARQFKGGEGDDRVRFVDIEGGWFLNHEAITHASPEILFGTNKVEQWHGTAVLGVIMMQNNLAGGQGMVPGVKCDVMGSLDENDRLVIGSGIVKAMTKLQFGDVLLIEVHLADEDGNFFPVETAPTLNSLIRMATEKGIIVIEAAGNGNLNLDSYQNRFGKKILNRNDDAFVDTGAIMVGACTSRSNARIPISNFGSRVDCCAWGNRVGTASTVTTIDNGNQGPEFKFGYMNDFDGTSSASAIIAGVALTIQSILVKNGRKPFGPAKMRQVLSSFSARPDDDTDDRIGTMPDLRKIIEAEIPNADPVT